MSEGPEVRRTADRLAEALVGDASSASSCAGSRRSTPKLQARVEGARVREVRTHGKHLVIAFSGGV